MARPRMWLYWSTNHDNRLQLSSPVTFKWVSSVFWPWTLKLTSPTPTMVSTTAHTLIRMETKGTLGAHTWIALTANDRWCNKINEWGCCALNDFFIIIIYFPTGLLQQPSLSRCQLGRPFLALMNQVSRPPSSLGSAENQLTWLSPTCQR